MKPSLARQSGEAALLPDLAGVHHSGARSSSYAPGSDQLMARLRGLAQMIIWAIVASDHSSVGMNVLTFGWRPLLTRSERFSQLQKT